MKGLTNTGREPSNFDYDVKICTNSTTRDGRLYHRAEFRFSPDGQRKASKTCRVRIAFDEETNRIYFFTGDGKDGAKMSGKDGHPKTASFKVRFRDEWDKLRGTYLMKKDHVERAYFIDVELLPEKDLEWRDDV